MTASVTLPAEAPLSVPLVPLAARYRAAQHRLTATFGHLLGNLAATLCLDSSIEDLKLLGVEGPGLIVAAEHMAGSRLREQLGQRMQTGVQPARAGLASATA